MSSLVNPLLFSSIEWFKALKQIVNHDTEFRRLGTVEAEMGIKVGDQIFVITFEAFECTQVRTGSLDELIDLDFHLELTVDDWKDLLENTKLNDGADRQHTLNTLDLMKEDGLAHNAAGDQLRGDIFFRINQSLQHYFDLSAKINTVFE